MGKVGANALALLFGNLGPVLLAMVGPIVVVTATSTLLLPLIGPANPGLAAGLYGIVLFLMWVGFASVLHARFLLGGRGMPPWRTVVWSRAQVSFLLGILKIIGILMLVALVLGVVTVILGTIGAVIIGLVSAILWARYLMVLPAAAVGRPMSLGESWGLTGHAKVRVVILVAVFYGIAQILGGVVELASEFLMADVSLVFGIALNAFMVFALSALFAAGLSATYRGLVEMRPPEARDTYIPQDGKHFADAF